MNLSDLPAPISAYFEADRAADPQRIADCFTPDALVHDEQHAYRGSAEIAAWKAAAHEKYQYTSEPLSAQVAGQSVRVHARLVGTFPGSPVEVDYRFTLTGDKISELAIE